MHRHKEFKLNKSTFTCTFLKTFITGEDDIPEQWRSDRPIRDSRRLNWILQHRGKLWSGTFNLSTYNKSTSIIREISRISVRYEPVENCAHAHKMTFAILRT